MCKVRSRTCMVGYTADRLPGEHTLHQWQLVRSDEVRASAARTEKRLKQHAALHCRCRCVLCCRTARRLLCRGRVRMQAVLYHRTERARIRL